MKVQIKWQITEEHIAVYIAIADQQQRHEKRQFPLNMAKSCNS